MYASSPVINEDMFDYAGAVEYSVRDRLMQERLYGCAAMGIDGLRLVYKEEEE